MDADIEFVKYAIAAAVAGGVVLTMYGGIVLAEKIENNLPRALAALSRAWNAWLATAPRYWRDTSR